MSIIRFVAFRYLLAKKRTNFVNIVTGISFAGVLVGAASLIVVLSVYNGLESLTERLYSKFNPDIRITPSQGKWLDIQELNGAIAAFNAIDKVSFSLQENALIRYGDREVVGVIKGVDTAYHQVADVPSTMIRGEFVLRDGFGLPYAMLGSGLAYQLQISLNDFRRGLDVYMPRAGVKVNLLNPESAFVRRSLQPAGIFDIQPEINEQYMLVPLAFVQDLLALSPERVGAAELKVKPGFAAEKVAKQMQAALGSDFDVRDRFRQEEAIFKIFRTEKWWTYFFLLLIVLVAALNLTGSLSMLVIDKKKDMAVLRSLGAKRSLLFGIFLFLGLAITFLGALLGIGLGSLLCWLQQEYAFIQFAGEGTFVVNAYPIQLRWSDVGAVMGGVMLIGTFCALYPAFKAAAEVSVDSLKT